MKDLDHTFRVDIDGLLCYCRLDEEPVLIFDSNIQERKYKVYMCTVEGEELEIKEFDNPAEALRNFADRLEGMLQ